MSEGNKRKINYCIYCGAEIGEGNVYCPKCGKLGIKIKSNTISSQSEIVSEKGEFSRKCSGCGSLISSTRLEQCPLCNTVLESVPEQLKPKTQKQSGYIFANKKLRPEHKFEIRKEAWNSREGYKVFEVSIFAYLSVFMVVIMILYTQIDPDTQQVEPNIFIIFLETLPVIALGVYPIVYIIVKKNHFIKLGIHPDIKKIAIALVIGVFGAIGIYLINLLSNYAFSLLVDAGFENFVAYNANIIEANQIIRDSSFWVIIYCILVSLMAIASEIAYRGVLHNTIKQKYGEEIKGKIIVSLLVALVYAGIEILVFLISDIYIGFFLFFSDLIFFFLLGILYELNGNLYNTIFSHVFYNLLIVLIIFLF